MFLEPRVIRYAQGWRIERIFMARFRVTSQDAVGLRRMSRASPAGAQLDGHEVTLPTWTAAQAEDWLAAGP